MLLPSNNSKKRTDYWGRTDQGLRGGMTCLFSCPMTCISMLSHASSGISNILLQGCHQSLITKNLIPSSIKWSKLVGKTRWETQLSLTQRALFERLKFIYTFECLVLWLSALYVVCVRVTVCWDFYDLSSHWTWGDNFPCFKLILLCTMSMFFS